MRISDWSSEVCSSDLLADQALTLDRDGLHGIHLSDRIYALLLRHTLQPAALEGMSGGEVVAYAVGAGWIGREGANRLELGHYRVEGDAADRKSVVSGKSVSVRLDPGGPLILKNKNQNNTTRQPH